MRADLPAELIFICAIILTVGALILYGMIIRRLLKLIKAKYIWIFPVLGGVLLLVLAAVHIYRVLFYFPMLSTAGPGDLFELIIGSLSLARVESFLLMGAGILALIGGLSYYLTSSK
ncbi:MAG: hypothetical protein JSV53_07785 [candidate division WOR-3 bacterium]|nr:MAG: hypothetical protein JSV53_07785 [candidate division WOR-3 bacterium]